MPNGSTKSATKFERPVSPHLQIYRPLINMVMSILHRLTGAALYFGTILLAWWLVAVASGPDYFTHVNGLFSSWPGIIVLFGYTWALMHHMFGGIRHLIWDTGHGYDLKTIDLLSWGTAVLSAVTTVGLWFVAWNTAGGP